MDTTDWIDTVAAERQRGFNRPLLPSQHDAVNARYHGLTVKRCQWCDEPIDDGSNFCSDECADAWQEKWG